MPHYSMTWDVDAETAEPETRAAYGTCQGKQNIGTTGTGSVVQGAQTRRDLI